MRIYTQRDFRFWASREKYALVVTGIIWCSSIALVLSQV